MHPKYPTDKSVPKRFVLRLRAILNRYGLAIGFFSIILMPTLFFGQAGPSGVELKENRELQAFPKASLFFFQNLEKWYSDHFGGRSNLIYYGARLQMVLLGIPGHRQVVLGKDQWLFYDQQYLVGQPRFADFLGKARFTQAQLGRIQHHLRQTHESLKGCNISFYFVMPPDKQTIYSEMMSFTRPENRQTRADQLFTMLKNTPEVNVIDLRQPLLQAKKIENLPLYYKTDTHWNALGAYYGVNAVMTEIHQNSLYSSINIKRSDYHLVTEKFKGGDIAISLLSLPDYFQDIKIELKSNEEIRKYKEIDGRKILIYGDSFSEAMIYFLKDYFQDIKVYRSAQLDASEINQENPSIVILEVLERLIGSLEKGPLSLPNCEKSSFNY